MRHVKRTAVKGACIDFIAGFQVEKLTREKATLSYEECKRFVVGDGERLLPEPRNKEERKLSGLAVKFSVQLDKQHFRRMDSKLSDCMLTVCHTVLRYDEPAACIATSLSGFPSECFKISRPVLLTHSSQRGADTHSICTGIDHRRHI